MPFCYFRASFIEIYRSLTCGLIFNFNNKILNKLNFTSIIQITSLWYSIYSVQTDDFYQKYHLSTTHSYLLSILITPWNPPYNQVFSKAQVVVSDPFENQHFLSMKKKNHRQGKYVTPVWNWDADRAPLESVILV